MKNSAKVVSFGWLGYKKYLELTIANYPFVMIQEVSNSHGLCISISIYHNHDYDKIEKDDPIFPNFLLVFDAQVSINQIRACSYTREDYFATYTKYLEYCKIHDARSISEKDYKFFEENAGIQSLLFLIVETLPDLFYESIPERN